MPGHNSTFPDSLDSADLSGGTLFYPCCGSDVLAPIRHFSSRVSRFAFADLVHPSKTRLRRIIEVQSETESHVPNCLPPRLPSSDALGNEPQDRSDVRSLHTFRATYQGRAISIDWHQYDAVDALERLRSVSVFFHRCDTTAHGEGSSGIPWLQQNLFELILSKMTDTGFFVTDGSNGYSHSVVQPWASLWRDRQTKGAQIGAEGPPGFVYRNAAFTWIGRLSSRSPLAPPTYVWKVRRRQ